MKGFIEVHLNDVVLANGNHVTIKRPRLVNINQITCVSSTGVITLTSFDCYSNPNESDYYVSETIHCVESYEEVKRLIAEAQ